MEAVILAAEDEVVRLEAIFAAPDFYATHAADWQKLEAELRAARDRVAQLYERWAELGAIANAALEPSSEGSLRQNNLATQ
jgi:hypothetical protein